MFDISFGELLLIGLVALVVLGPERLPVVARTLGALVARAQRFVASVKQDIEQQTDMSGLTSLRQEVRSTAYALKAQLEAEMESARASIVAIPTPIAPGLPPAPTPDAPDDGQASLPLETPTAAPLNDADLAAEAQVHDENQLELFSDPPPTSRAPDPQQ